MNEDHQRRTVRSFVRREGRMTEGQIRAWQRLWPRYGLDCRGQLDLAAVFGRQAPRVLEIGFGDGEALVALAQANPDTDYLGVEVYRPGIGRLLRRLEAQGLTNVRIVHDDALAVLRDAVPRASLDRVHCFFPDPWPKKRHHKRRLVQPLWAQRVADRLKAGGVLHLATDWEDYAMHMRAVLEATPALINLHGAECFAPWPGARPPTKFEQRGQDRGHQVWDLIYLKPAGAAQEPAD